MRIISIQMVFKALRLSYMNKEVRLGVPKAKVRKCFIETGTKCVK